MTVHIVAQQKGGIGKSFLAVALGDFLRRQAPETACFDVDIGNATFSQFLGLEAIEIGDEADASIDPQHFDTLFSRLLNLKSDAVVDFGSPEFKPLMHYVGETETIRVLSDKGVRVVFHTVIAGGAAMEDCFESLEAIVAQVDECAAIIPWRNGFYGTFVTNGRDLANSPEWLAIGGRLHAVGTIPSSPNSLVRSDVEALQRLRLTFSEVAGSEDLSIWQKSRLHRVEAEFAGQFKTVLKNVL